MKTETFNKVAKETLDKAYKLLTQKQKEYTIADDRFDYFKKAAMLQSTTADKALLGFLTKHIVSVFDMINSNKDFTLEKWDEKVIDVICYMCLLRGLKIEELEKESSEGSIKEN